ncbi:MAG: gliding motility protein GldM [Bacteroidales bacterium]|jgi:gliding motility-associated protein GldM|nr:gliding motility protein GldM [Bacteroidales bacterium]
MSHGKETPRQKMIGMMYLVLTAMLALNVTAEVLDAFDAVDEGLKKTSKNFTEKNQVLYSDFNEQYAQNETKVKPWKDKADEVKRRSDELFDYIQGLKIDIIKDNGQGDPEDGVITEDGEIVNEKIKGKDKYDAPSRVLIGPNMDGKAFELRSKIKDYKDFLINLVDEKDVSLMHSLEINLETKEPPPSKDGERKEWEVKHFANMPIAAVMPLLTKMQLDVRNSEAEIGQYLFRQIDAGSFAVNKIEATVIPNSSYILQGNEYKADVFLAALDTTAPPIVFIGEYDSTLNEDGGYEFNMVGSYDSLDVLEGKGKFSRLSTTIGKQKWGGLIKVMGPDGGYITKTFRREYQIAKANLVVSPTKMNVFYVGVDNPVSVSIAGVPGHKVSPSMTNGSIRKQRDGEYIVNPKRPGNSIISVRAEIDGVTKNMGTVQFRVRGLPDPVVKVAGKKGGRIQRNVLAAQAGVIADMENFEFDLEFKITKFTVSTTDRGGYTIDSKTNGNIFTRAQQDLIKNLRRGQRLNIEDVRAIGPDGSVRPLASIVFEII